MLNEGEAETHVASRRPDSDAPERYRLYEVPGAAHMIARDGAERTVLEELSDFPMASRSRSCSPERDTSPSPARSCRRAAPEIGARSVPLRFTPA